MSRRNGAAGGASTDLPPSLVAVIRDANPWWRGERVYGVPPMRRWAFASVMSHLRAGLTPVLAVRGPRRVGKSVLMDQAIHALLDDGVDPRRILRLVLDDLPVVDEVAMPLLDIPRWYATTILGTSLNQAAHDGEGAFVFLDELQAVRSWAPQLKHLVDVNPVRVLVTGSSALSIGAGEDSLAGRIVTLEMGPFLLHEVARLRGLGELPTVLPPNGLAPLRDKALWLDLRSLGERHGEVRRAAFAAFAERGGFPLAHVHAEESWEAVGELLTETVVERVLRHDVAASPGGHGRDPLLLEGVLRAAFRFAGQAPTGAYLVDDVKRSVPGEVTWPKVAAYLRILHETLLIRLVEPLDMRLKRRRGGDKICLCDHALRAAWLQEVVPLTASGLDAAPELSGLAGHLAESIAGSYLATIRHLGVSTFPERPGEPEVDLVVTVGDQRLPVEVKYRRRIDYSDTLGLRSFIEKAHYNAPFGLLVTLRDEAASDDPRIVSLPLSTLMLLR